MYSKVELLGAVEELLQSKHTIQNCEKLSAVYNVLDHLYPEDIAIMDRGHSFDGPATIGRLGDSEFLTIIADMRLEDIMPLIDELVSTIQILNPRLYASFMRKLTE